MRYLWIAALVAFAFYGSVTGDTIRPGDLVSGVSVIEKDADFAERWGKWEFIGSGITPLDTESENVDAED
jgi:hypothetical protein